MSEKQIEDSEKPSEPGKHLLTDEIAGGPEPNREWSGWWGGRGGPEAAAAVTAATSTNSGKVTRYAGFGPFGPRGLLVELTRSACL